MKRIIRRIIRYSNLAFAILLVLSFLSPNISPTKIWFPSFLGLAYPYILLVNLAFMLFWILMKKREFILSFLAILLGWNTLVRYFSLHPGSLFKKAYFDGLEQTEREEGGQLKIMSYNVRAFDLYKWTGNASNRQHILELIRANDPDVLCLQEFYTSERGAYRAEDIHRALENTPYRHIEILAGNTTRMYGTALYSRYPIVNKGRVELNSPPSLCSFTDILFGNDTLRIYNLHLQSTRLSSRHYRMIDSLKFRYDYQQMEEIRDLSSRLKDAFIKRAAQADLIAAHLSDCPYPVILCGDFNDTPVSYAYRRIGDGLQDVFAECGWGTGRTYNGKFPSFRIDYIFTGEEFEAMHFTRLKVRLSDHFPITGFLKLR